MGVFQRLMSVLVFALFATFGLLSTSAVNVATAHEVGAAEPYSEGFSDEDDGDEDDDSDEDESNDDDNNPFK